MKKIDIFLTKNLLCIILFLTIAIISKQNTIFKEKVEYELYQNHLSFSSFKKIYNKYLGGIVPLENITNQKENAVFSEKITYNNITPYLNGASLEVENNYLVPSQENGTIVFIGEKEGYNNVVIIENNNIDTWYGNLCNISVKLYDNIEKGSYFAETCDNHLYIAYTKDNNFIDYKDKIK